MSSWQDLASELDALGNPTIAEHSQRFFKTYEGGYAEGDQFIGLRVPVTRKIAGKYNDMELTEIEKLLESPIHEHRLAALVIMVNKYKKAKKDLELRRQLYELYLKRTDCINNWDLVDISCRDIVGAWLMDKPKDPLYKMAKSKHLWERRIAIVSTWQFIRERKLDETFKISEMLLQDNEDLIHKAVGWMLREAGKKDEDRLREFLDKHAHEMPRTMLRYSIEKLHAADRTHYMNAKNSANV